jgi:hypothetical protein
MNIKTAPLSIRDSNNDTYYGRIKSLSIRQKCGQLESDPNLLMNDTTACTINTAITATFNFDQVQCTTKERRSFCIGDLMKFRVIKKFGIYKAHDVIKVDKDGCEPNIINQKHSKNQVYLRGRICSIRDKAKDGIIKSIRNSQHGRALITYFVFDNVVDYPEQEIQVGDYVKFHKQNDVAFDVVRCLETKKATPELEDNTTPTITLSLTKDQTSSYHTIVEAKRKKNSSRTTTELTPVESVINRRKISRSTLTSQESSVANSQNKYSVVSALKESPTLPINFHPLQSQVNHSHMQQHVNAPFTQPHFTEPIQIQYSGMNMMPYQQNLVIPEPLQQVYSSPLYVNDINYITDPAIYYPSTPIYCIDQMTHLSAAANLYTQPDHVLSFPHTQPPVTMISGTPHYTILQPHTSVTDPGTN